MTFPVLQSDQFVVPAGESVLQYRQGDFLSCFDADQTDFTVETDLSSDDLSFFAGAKVRFPQEFRWYRIKNPNLTALTVKVFVGAGDVDDNRVNVPAGLATRPRAADLVANTFVNAVTGAGTILTPDLANIAWQWVEVPDDQTDPVTIAGNKLYPGQSILLHTAARLTAVSLAASGTTRVNLAYGRWSL